MRRLLTFLFWLTSGVLAAQHITLSVRVQDKQSGEPLPFATVGLKGKSIGTITNLHGDFDFHIPEESRNDILIISMLGYENLEAPVWSVIGQSTLVLTRSTTYLSEVVVSDSLKGADILAIALARVPQNFPMKPFLLDGFYRDIKKVGGTYIALLEAAVQVFDENYEEPRNKAKLRERVRLLEVRKSLGYENNFKAYFGQQNLLEDLLLHNNIRYWQFDVDDLGLRDIRRAGNSYYNQHEVYVLEARDEFHLKIYIDKEDFSIIHLDFSVEQQGPALDRRRNMVCKSFSHQHSIDFKRFDQKMYLNYITVTKREDWYDEKTQEHRFQTELSQQLLINAVYDGADKRISSTEKMRNYGLQYQDYPYNKSFWENYNVIKETPLNEKIRRDLEKVAPLDKQFEQD